MKSERATSQVETPFARACSTSTSRVVSVFGDVANWPLGPEAIAARAESSSSNMATTTTGAPAARPSLNVTPSRPGQPVDPLPTSTSCGRSSVPALALAAAQFVHHSQADRFETAADGPHQAVLANFHKIVDSTKSLIVTTHSDIR